MADDLTRAEPTPLVRPPRDELRVHRTRFALAYVALAALAGAAVGAAILLVDRPETVGAAWSTWKPEGDEDAFPERIAEHVAGRYQLSVGILAGPPRVRSGDQDVSVRAVFIRPRDRSREDLRPVETDESVMYEMCGIGDGCALGDGETTDEFGLLLRREALELALYSFKYVDDTDSVIVLMPPATKDDQGTALFFERDDFRAELRRPLELTLVRTDVAPPSELDPAEVLVVDRLTRPRLFLYEFQPLQAGGAAMVLAPVGLAQQP